MQMDFNNSIRSLMMPVAGTVPKYTFTSSHRDLSTSHTDIESYLAQLIQEAGTRDLEEQGISKARGRAGGGRRVKFRRSDTGIPPKFGRSDTGIQSESLFFMSPSPSKESPRLKPTRRGGSGASLDLQSTAGHELAELSLLPPSNEDVKNGVAKDPEDAKVSLGHTDPEQGHPSEV